ncbi:uncharacterized protein PRCAT00003508001 [Priceomyces carsonii]|uniref:uncharacterized protein n=1 Tax=Priceomyces carsonii TaxID=28549 RepID=UPI002ED86F57|nr:unnamed protein product [Priceomyces carsonii]
MLENKTVESVEYTGTLSEHGVKCLNVKGEQERVAETFNLSHAIIVPSNKSFVFTSGHIGCDDDMFSYTPSIEVQMFNAFENIEKTLVGAGALDGWGSVIQLTTYHLNDIQSQEFGDALNKVYEKYLNKNRPGCTILGVSQLGIKGMLVEVQVTAIIDT